MTRPALALWWVMLLAVAGAARAEQPTEPAPGDARVRFISYDPHNVVTIYGKVGMDTLVMFEKGEQVQDLGGGDTEAWGIGVITAGNGFFIKPKVTSPNTNVHVVTDKRVYSIDMKLARKGQTNFLTVWYRYPLEEKAGRKAVADRETVRDLLNKGGREIGAKNLNRSYSVQGSDDLTPSEAWDDGTATYFRFAGSRVPPAPYIVGEDGKESIANVSTQPDGTFVIHAVVRKLVFRAGKLVTCIFNDRFDPNGAKPATNTVSPLVDRVVKKGAPK